MKGFSVFRSAVSRPLSASGHRGKLSIGVSIVLVSLAGVMDLEAHSQTAFFSGAELTVPTDNLNQPNAIAVDQVGNLYIADSGNARVLKMTLSAGSYTESVVATGTTQVNGIAVDSNGNIYFGNAGTGQILKETPSGGGGYSQSVVSTSSLTSIGGLAADTSGNVYVVDTGGSRVLKEALSGTNYTESTIGTGLVNPRGVAVDKSGNVYISDTGNGRVLMETLSGGSYTQSALIRAASRLWRRSRLCG